MIAKMILTSECLVADITFVRSLICVGSFVDEQIVGFGELSFAEATNEFYIILSQIN